jgi:hypothetical protein
MPSKTLLRTLILIQIPLLILIGVATYLFVRHATGNLVFMVLQKDHYRPGASVIAGATAVALLVANIGVFFFWRGMRTFYLIVMIVAVLQSVYLGPFANSGPADFFESAMNTVSGIILGLVFFSPARELFGRPAAAGPAMGPVVQMPMPTPPAAPMSWTPAPPPPAPPAPPVEFAPPEPAITPEPVATPEPVITPEPVAPKPVPVCAKCGTPSTGTKFCEECGALFVAKIQCPACGAEIRPGKKFCGECGGPVQ